MVKNPGKAGVEVMRVGLKIGKNDPCLCGSGIKFKKCCIGKTLQGGKAILSAARIDLDSFPPEIEGLDETPDLKAWLNKALRKQVSEFDFNPKTFFARQMREYNNRMAEVNSKLPKPYGDVLTDMCRFVSERNYEEAVKLGDVVLRVFPESEEAKKLNEEALWLLNRHPLQLLYAEILATSEKSSRKKLLDRFWEKAIKCETSAVKNIFYMAAGLYRKGGTWEQRYLALDIIKATRLIEIGEEATKKLDDLLLDALRDDDGRVRNNAFFCAARIRGLYIPVNFFFKIFEAAKQEENHAKLNALCRTLLEMVCPSTDDVMSSVGEWKEYQKALDFALKITKYDPTYYKAGSVEKMRLHWKDWRIKSRRLGEEKDV